MVGHGLQGCWWGDTDLLASEKGLLVPFLIVPLIEEICKK